MTVQYWWVLLRGEMLEISNEAGLLERLFGCKPTRVAAVSPEDAVRQYRRQNGQTQYTCIIERRGGPRAR